MAFPTDGDTVRAVRERLAQQGVPQDEPWRSTVVSHEQHGWVVRTWTHTPRDAARPAGVPDYVHHVASDGKEARELRIDQVQPPLPQ